MMNTTEDWYGDILKGEGQFDENGLKTGYWRFFDEKHTYHVDGFYLQGKMHGEWSVYKLPDHTLQTSTFFRFGVQYGSFRMYFKTGNLNLKGRYKNNQPHGIWTEYTVTNKLHRVQHLDNGVNHGDFIIYLNGKKVWTNKYYKGTPLGEHRYYRFSEMVAHGCYTDGMKSGIWKYFYESGELAATGNYDENNMNGLWKFFNRKQELVGEALFDHGEVMTQFGNICVNEDELLDFCEIRYI
jgi:antitoxin component YwqK of YwqJK toxin-antitoxin module